MRCPYCNNPDSKVTDSRAVDDGIRRRRECSRCGLRFTTYERVQTTALLVSKRDGRKQEFDRHKLMARVNIACAKRPIPHHEIEKLVSDIESDLQALGRAEIPSSAVGEMVMERLRDLDRVAYIRWASVYRDFQDLESFEQAVNDLKKEEDNSEASSSQLSMLEDAFPAKRTPNPRARRQKN